MSEITRRIVSSLVLAPIVVALILAGGASGIAYMLAALGAVLAWEWEYMIYKKTSILGIFLGALATMTAFEFMDMPVAVLAAMGVATVALAIVGFRKKIKQKWFLALGVPYICLPIAAMTYIAQVHSHSNVILLWLVFTVWATDIGGYLFGMLIGGPKLAPKISPRKTWAGAGGGVVMAMVVSVLFVGVEMFPEIGERPVMAIVLYIAEMLPWAAGISIVAQIGDLCESWIKRRLFIKDSSNIIPGHGGLFDRIDGLLLATPVMALAIAVLDK
jgi:phosphatidate cytidylyltransferase